MTDVLSPLIKKFLPFAQKRMGFDNPPKLFLKNDSEMPVTHWAKLHTMTRLICL